MDFKYFDMKYVYNEWHAGLKDELCFYEDIIDDLIEDWDIRQGQS